LPGFFVGFVDRTYGHGFFVFGIGLWIVLVVVVVVHFDIPLCCTLLVRAQLSHLPPPRSILPVLSLPLLSFTITITIIISLPIPFFPLPLPLPISLPLPPLLQLNPFPLLFL
jgi:hypothetical protein